MDENDEFEHIPWSTLLPEPRGDRVRQGAIVVLVAAALAIGFMTARAVGADVAPVSNSAEPVAATAPVPTEPGPSVPAAAEPTRPTTSEPPGDAPGPTAPLYTEADLMAALPVGQTGLHQAMAHAELYVIDYFTVGGPSVEEGTTTQPDAGDGADRAAALPGATTYVEWAKAFDASAPTQDGDRIEITVAFRMLASADGSTFVRKPIRAVRVSIHRRQDGATAVADVPSPARLPTYAVAPTELEAVQLPEAVADEMRRQVAAFAGSEADSSSAEPALDPDRSGQVDGAWYGVVVWRDPTTGIAWPLALEMTD